MAKPDKSNSPENGSVLVPPDGGGQHGGGGSHDGRMVFVGVGLALLLLLAAIVIWILPGLGGKQIATRQTVQPISPTSQQLTPAAPPSVVNSGTDRQSAEAIRLLDEIVSKISRESMQREYVSVQHRTLLFQDFANLVKSSDKKAEIDNVLKELRSAPIYEALTGHLSG